MAGVDQPLDRDEPFGDEQLVAFESAAEGLVVQRPVVVEARVVASIHSRGATWYQRAKTCESSANDLNSRALPDGSSRNIVDCSPDLADEPGVRLDDEVDAGRAGGRATSVIQSSRLEEHTEVRNGHVVAVHGVLQVLDRARIEPLVEVGDDLVAVQVEVDPVSAPTALRASEHVTVELPRGGEVVDRHREVEAGRRASDPSSVHSGMAYVPWADAVGLCDRSSHQTCDGSRRRYVDRPTASVASAHSTDPWAGRR